jgi:glycosyltransferase involved in cell wall biosynthesis
VIIPTYNNACFLPDAIQSVLTQTYRDFEIIVVDDGSTDNTLQVLDPFRDSIRYIAKSRGGPASARNTGIRASGGGLIAFLDADDLWMAEKLQLQVTCLKINPETGLVFTNRVLSNKQGLVCSKGDDRILNLPKGNLFGHLLATNLIVMSTVMVRRSCLDQIGLFDESLYGAEDINLVLRLSHSFGFQCIDRALVHKRYHSANVSDQLDSMCGDEVRNVEKISALFPTARIPVRQLQGRVLLRFGKEHFGYQDLRAARRCFLGAVRKHPSLLSAWGFLMLSSVPQSFRYRIVWLRRRLRRRPQTAFLSDTHGC